MPALQQARDAGILVIALDTPLEPADAADATFATDNFKAGELIGQWAAAKLGDERSRCQDRAASTSTRPRSRSTSRATRASCTGFGIDVKDPTDIGDEDDPRIVGHDITPGRRGGRPHGDGEPAPAAIPSINVVYTINEPAAAGAYEALKRGRHRRAGVLIVSVDGGCPGVQNVKDGVIGATSMQFPLLMAAMGVEAVKLYAETGAKPETQPGPRLLQHRRRARDRRAGQKASPRSPRRKALKKCWG